MLVIIISANSTRYCRTSTCYNAFTFKVSYRVPSFNSSISSSYGSWGMIILKLLLSAKWPTNGNILV